MNAILLLHGVFTDSNDFRDILFDLDKRYDCVYKITFPGHGINDNYKNFKVEETFNLLLKTFDSLAIKYDKIDVIGFSMGGALATYLASVRNFDKLVLVAPANKYLNWRVPIDRVSFFFKTLLNKKKTEEVSPNKMVYIDEIRGLSRILRYMIPEYTIKALITFMRIVDKCNKEIKKIKNPVLILGGKLDPLVPKGAIDFDYEHCVNENKKIVIYDDMSHVILNSMNSYQAVEEILAFLDTK